MPKISGQNEPDCKNEAELLHGSLLLHQNKISLTDWLKLFTVASDGDASASLRWVMGSPEFCVETYYGEIPGLTLAVRSRIDRIVAESSCRSPGFIEDFLPNSASTAAATLVLDDPRLLFAIVDWSPACIVIAVLRAPDRPAWNTADRERIKRLLPAVHESVEVHKLIAKSHYIAGLARDLLDKSPRGILVLSDDGVIRMANKRAAAILAANDGLSEKNGKLVIHCPAVAERVRNYLATVGTSNNAGLPEMDWNMVAKKRSGGAAYQLIVGNLQLSQWHLESRHSNKVAVIHLHDPGTSSIAVDPKRLTDFYGFTKAQARVAAKLYNGHTINEAAEALHISVNTARTHMRGIYAKSGVRTQAELLGLLSSGLTSYGETIENNQHGELQP
jgi:DNA-binding CsgD family transcriptional regulator/PAS domain-containing protein